MAEIPDRVLKMAKSVCFILDLYGAEIKLFRP